MELIVLWWMIEEDEEDDGDAVEDDGEVVVPSPFLCQILYEAPGYHRAKHRNRHRGEEDKAIGRTTHFVGNQLAQNSGKGQLPRCAEPDEDVCAYEVITPFAVAATIEPIKARPVVVMKKYRRPKISDMRPMSAYPMASESVHASDTHMTFGLGPMSALIS